MSRVSEARVHDASLLIRARPGLFLSVVTISHEVAVILHPRRVPRGACVSWDHGCRVWGHPSPPAPRDIAQAQATLHRSHNVHSAPRRPRRGRPLEHTRGPTSKFQPPDPPRTPRGPPADPSRTPRLPPTTPPARPPADPLARGPPADPPSPSLAPHRRISKDACCRAVES